MPQQLSITGMELGPWTAVTGTTIAPCPPDAYEAVQLSDGTRFYAIKSTPYPAGVEPYAGVLWTQPHALLPMSAPFTAKLVTLLEIDDAALKVANAIELDFMYSDKNGNVANCSGEYLPSTGQWMVVDGSGAWKPAGALPPPIPKQPTPIEILCSIDPLKSISTVLSVSMGGVAIVPQIANVPFFKLAWGPNLGVVQVQMGFGPNGGAFSEKITNMSLTVTQ